MLPTPQDRFRSLPALMSEFKENEDYLLRVNDRKSEVTVISPHGGFIEPGTSAIAKAVAGRNYNFFDFQGLRVERPWELHVTSTRFRHPRLDELLAQSTFAVSIHGMGTVDSWNVWLGGLNTSLKQHMNESLTKSGFSVITNAPRYKGESPGNVVNLARYRGVQLELPKDLIEAMFVDGVTFSGQGTKPRTTPMFRRFVRAVRSAVSADIQSR